MKFVKAILASVALMFLMGQGCATPTGFSLGPGMGMGGGSMGGGGQCQSGSHPSMDSMGNHICQDDLTGRTVSTASNGITGCPNGASPAMDSMGNRVCRNDMTGQTFYDTSRGCPMGTHLGADAYGRPACVTN